MKFTTLFIVVACVLLFAAQSNAFFTSTCNAKRVNVCKGVKSEKACEASYVRSSKGIYNCEWDDGKCVPHKKCEEEKCKGVYTAGSCRGSKVKSMSDCLGSNGRFTSINGVYHECKYNFLGGSICGTKDDYCHH